MINILIVILLAVQVFIWYLIKRNFRVYDFRIDWNNEVHHGKDSENWRENSKIMHCVSYDEMMWKFWIPLSKFKQIAKERYNKTK